MTNPKPARATTARFVWGLAAFAFAVRVGAMWAIDSPHELGARSAWTFGYEASTIARSLSEGLGFSNLWMRPESPWDQPSGATGWLPPVYPALLAGMMTLAGGITPALAAWLFVVQAALSAATCAAIVALGAAIGEARVGRIAGVVFALYPLSIWNAVHTVWDTTLAALGFAVFTWALFRYGRGRSLKSAALLGAGFGALLWINPAPLSVAPLAAIVVARGDPRERSWSLPAAVLFCAAAFAACSPWMLRNARAVGAFSLRTNLGVELAVGNNDRATGHYQPALHPSFNPSEFAAFRALGEVAYAEQRMSEARGWIASHPGRFLGLSWKRAWIFWFGEAPWSDPRREGTTRAIADPQSWIKWVQHALCGLLAIAGAIGLARRSFEGRVLAGILVCYPLAYYVTHFMERYRFPIEPVLVLLATWRVVTWLQARRSRYAPANERD